MPVAEREMLCIFQVDDEAYPRKEEAGFRCGGCFRVMGRIRQDRWRKPGRAERDDRDEGKEG